MLSGPLSWNFWVGEVLLAITLPLVLVAVTKARNVKALGLASLLFMVGFFFTKYDFVIAGQVPTGKGDFVGYGLEPHEQFCRLCAFHGRVDDLCVGLWRVSNSLFFGRKTP